MGSIFVLVGEGIFSWVNPADVVSWSWLALNARFRWWLTTDGGSRMVFHRRYVREYYRFLTC